MGTEWLVCVTSILHVCYKSYYPKLLISRRTKSTDIFSYKTVSYAPIRQTPNFIKLDYGNQINLIQLLLDIS